MYLVSHFSNLILFHFMLKSFMKILVLTNARILKPLIHIRRKLSLTICAFLPLIILMSACKPPQGPNKGKDNNSKKGPALVSVEVGTLKKGPMERVVKGATDLEAEESVSVFARTSNYVAELLVEEGDQVQKGDILARLEDDIQLTQLQKAQVIEEKLRLEYERLKNLSSNDIVSEQEFKNAELDYNQQKLVVEEAQRELAFTEIIAPISGTVTQRLINLGDIVNNGQQAFDLVNFDSIKAPVFFPEAELARIRVGQIARVQAPSLSEDLVQGRVERISPLVDAQSGTVEVMIGFEDTGSFRPGMYVNVTVVTDTLPDALLIPKESLVYDADQIFVYRLIPGKDFPNRSIERIMVSPILEDRFHITVPSGFTPGDRIIITGKAGLRVDTLVRLPDDPMKAPDPEEKNTSDEDNKDPKKPSGKEVKKG